MTQFELEKEEQENLNRIRSILFNECNSMNRLRQSLMPKNITPSPENQFTETAAKPPVAAGRKILLKSRRRRSNSVTEKMENLAIQESSPSKKK